MISGPRNCPHSWVTVFQSSNGSWWDRNQPKFSVSLPQIQLSIETDDSFSTLWGTPHLLCEGHLSLPLFYEEKSHLCPVRHDTLNRAVLSSSQGQNPSLQLCGVRQHLCYMYMRGDYLFSLKGTSLCLVRGRPHNIL